MIMLNSQSFYDRKVLDAASPDLVMWNFLGRPKRKKHNKFVMFLRWLLRKEPDYEYEHPLLPKHKGKKIKFRRYASLSSNKEININDT